MDIGHFSASSEEEKAKIEKANAEILEKEREKELQETEQGLSEEVKNLTPEEKAKILGETEELSDVPPETLKDLSEGEVDEALKNLEKKD